MSNIVSSTATPQVLKNRGIPAKFHALEQTATGRWARKYDEAGEPQFENGYLQMTNSVLADIEDEVIGWGSLDAWQEGLKERPFQTLVSTIALLRDWRLPNDRPDRRRAGAAMVDGGIGEYSVAVGSAFMLANGAPEDRVGKQLGDNLLETGKSQAVQWDKVFADTESGILTPQLEGTPGDPGSKPGASSDAPSTSSGD